MKPNQEENPFAPTGQVPTEGTPTQPPVAATNDAEIVSVENQMVSEPVPEPIATAPVTPVVKTKASRPKWLLPLVIVVVALLLVGGAAAVYKFWYQNPTKVLSDSVLHLVTEKDPVTANGTFSVDSENASALFTFDSASKSSEGTLAGTVKITPKSDDFGGKSFTVKANGVFTKDGVTYLKVSDVKQAVADFVNLYVDQLAKSYKDMGYTITDADLNQARSSMHTAVDPIVEKFDGQWIKLTADDLDGDTDKSAKQYRCATDALKKLQNESDVKELNEVYKKHPFVSVTKELGAKNGSLGYELSYDKAKAKEFADASKDTAIAKAFDACDDTSSSSSSTSPDDKDTTETKTFQVWVSRWSHKLTGVTYEGTSTGSSDGEKTTLKLTATMSYNKPVTIEAPKGAKSFKELLDSFKSVTSTAGEV